MTNSGLTLVSAPAAEPVTLTEATTYLRITGTADDTLITSLITAARVFAEDYTERQLITATWRATWDAFPEHTFVIPRAPLIGVTSLQYYDTDDVLTTLDSANYVVDAASEPGRVVLATDYSWPSASIRPAAVRITFTAGYGASASDVPEPVKLAIKNCLATWYENRESVVTGTIATELPFAARMLLNQYRLGTYP